jgi:hypothetical protein
MDKSLALPVEVIYSSNKVQRFKGPRIQEFNVWCMECRGGAFCSIPQVGEFEDLPITK